MKIKGLLFFSLLFTSQVFSQMHEIEKYPYNFAVNQNKFRITEHLVKATKASSSYHIYLLESFNSKWNLIDTIATQYDVYGLLCLSDVNEDNYLNIICPEKWDGENVFYTILFKTHSLIVETSF